MAEEQKPKSRAKKIQASGVEAELQPANSASVPPGPGAAGVQGVVQASVPADDEEKLSKERRLFTVLANVCRYVGIVAGVGAIVAPLSVFGGDFSGFAAILPLIITGFVLMVLGIIFRALSVDRNRKLNAIVQARAEAAIRFQQQSLANDPSATASVELIINDFAKQTSSARTGGLVRVWVGASLMLITMFGSLVPALFAPSSDCSMGSCNFFGWALAGGFNFGLAIFLSVLQLVLPTVGLVLITTGAIKLSRAKRMRATLSGADTELKP
jgi:hypothetical protein